VQNRVPTPEQLKEAFSNKYKQPQPESKSEREEVPKVVFNAAFDEFIKECGTQNSWGEATYGKFAALKNHLTGFDENLSFEMLDETKLMAYVGYLRDIVDMRNNTLEKQISYLKWFLRWSVKKGYNNNAAFETFKPKLKYIQKKVIFLTWKELNRLREYVIPDTKKYLERVRDVFLFCCFTGLRYSDVYNLKRSDVKEDR
ncbi:hypothetical protein EZS27_042781, partial [termite gut metagenome]